MIDFSDLHVSLPVWIVSQVFMLFALVTIVISMQLKNKRRLLLAVGLVYIFYAINLALIQNWIVFVTIVVALVRNLIFAYYERRAEKGKQISNTTGWVTVFVFMLAIIIPTIFLWSWWFDWLLAAGSIPILIGAYVKGIHLFKTAIILKAILNIISFVFYLNLVGIIYETVVITSIIAFYIRLLVTKKVVPQEAE
ncbi:MAG: YgjV family protein [Firmicutes bacterium]|nr:YgjV family protein [Bacillota bacterium]